MAKTTHSVGARLLAVGAVFVVLGTAELTWADSTALAAGTVTGGVVTGPVGGYLILRKRRSTPVV